MRLDLGLFGDAPTADSPPVPVADVIEATFARAGDTLLLAVAFHPWFVDSNCDFGNCVSSWAVSRTAVQKCFQVTSTSTTPVDTARCAAFAAPAQRTPWPHPDDARAALDRARSLARQRAATVRMLDGLAGEAGVYFGGLTIDGSRWSVIDTAEAQWLEPLAEDGVRQVSFIDGAPAWSVSTADGASFSIDATPGPLRGVRQWGPQLFSQVHGALLDGRDAWLVTSLPDGYVPRSAFGVGRSDSITRALFVQRRDAELAEPAPLVPTQPLDAATFTHDGVSVCFNRPLADASSASVTLSPAVEVRRLVVTRGEPCLEVHTAPLLSDRRYAVTVRGVRTVAGDLSGEFTTSFKTPPAGPQPLSVPLEPVQPRLLPGQTLVFRAEPLATGGFLASSDFGASTFSVFDAFLHGARPLEPKGVTGVLVATDPGTVGVWVTFIKDGAPDSLRFVGGAQFEGKRLANNPMVLDDGVLLAGSEWFSPDGGTGTTPLASDRRRGPMRGTGDVVMGEPNNVTRFEQRTVTGALKASWTLPLSPGHVEGAVESGVTWLCNDSAGLFRVPEDGGAPERLEGRCQHLHREPGGAYLASVTPQPLVPQLVRISGGTRIAWRGTTKPYLRAVQVGDRVFASTSVTPDTNAWDVMRRADWDRWLKETFP